MKFPVKVVNFSHPLSSTALAQITEAITDGKTDVEVIDVKVQVDTNAPLAPQVTPLIEAAKDADYVVMPGLSNVAVLIARAIPTPVIVLKGVKNVAGITFEFAEII